MSASMDLDFVRHVLSVCDEAGHPVDGRLLTDAGHDAWSVANHVEAMAEAGLVVAKVRRVKSGVLSIRIERLTLRGADFLDNVRDESAWSHVKQTAAKAAGQAGLSLMVKLAETYMLNKISGML